MEPKRPDSIPGYEHPSSVSYSRRGIYKTFTEGKKARKNERFGRTTGGRHYASYGDIEEEECPVCGKPPVNTCPCGYSDKKCASGHQWYMTRDGKTKLGNPHQ